MSGGRLRATALAFVSLAAVLAIAGCSTPSTTGTGSTGSGTTGGGASAGGVQIVESGLAFEPAKLSVKVGDVVTFSNEDSVPHHVVVGTTDLGVQQPGTDVTWTARANGTMGVACLIHPSMTGQITVGTGGPDVPAAGGTGGGMPATSTGGSSGYGY